MRAPFFFIASSCSSKGAFHRGQQYIERVCIIMMYHVDKEGRGTAHSAMSTAFGILVHPMRKNMVLYRLGIQRLWITKHRAQPPRPPRPPHHVRQCRPL